MIKYEVREEDGTYSVIRMKGNMGWWVFRTGEKEE